ncbi:hypothetical protein DXA14_24495 [Hungatella hathewayi]|nr:hypothetical protein DXA14_24495 [Hungatella hathewayi]
MRNCRDRGNAAVLLHSPGVFQVKLSIVSDRTFIDSSDYAAGIRFKVFGPEVCRGGIDTFIIDAQTGPAFRFQGFNHVI